MLSQPVATLTFSQKAFAFGSPTIWNRLTFTADLLQLLTVLNANSKRFYLPQFTDLSSHRHQRHMALYEFLL